MVNLKEEALDRALWTIGCGRDCGPVARQATGRVDEWMDGWTSVIKRAAC